MSKNNGFFIWLKENRESIKKMYFSDYEFKVVDGKRETLSTLLPKKAGEIWKNLDSSIKDKYLSTNTNNDSELSKIHYNDIEYLHNITTNEIYDYKMFKESKEKKLIGFFDSSNKSILELKKLTDIKLSDNKTCPFNCGVKRKTFFGMLSHLGLKQDSANNCRKKDSENKFDIFKIVENMYTKVEDEVEAPPAYEDISASENKKPKSRKQIPKSIKKSVWNKYIETDDPNKLSGFCYVGCGTKITIDNFELGHVVAYSKGGNDKIDNLRPICSLCNKSMGTNNLLEFKDKYGLDSKVSQNVSISELITKENEYLELIKQMESVKITCTQKISLESNKITEIESKNINFQLEIEKCNNKIQSYESEKNQKILDLKKQIEEINKYYKLKTEEINTDIKSMNKNIKSNLAILKKLNSSNDSFRLEFEKNEAEKSKLESSLINIKKSIKEHHIEENIKKEKLRKELEDEVRAELEREKMKAEIRKELINQEKSLPLIDLSS